jgi:polyhydroxyalkanoate synthesis regulator phasin
MTGTGQPDDLTGQTPGGQIERAEGTVRRFVLAGIGAMATACDTAGQTYDRFVDRGAQVQTDLQERADEVRQRNLGARSRMGDYIRGAMDAFLNTVNVPSKGDVDTINVKLNILSRKLDDLQMERVRPARVEPEEEPPSPPPGPNLDMTT